MEQCAVTSGVHGVPVLFHFSSAIKFPYGLLVSVLCHYIQLNGKVHNWTAFCLVKGVDNGDTNMVQTVVMVKAPDILGFLVGPGGGSPTLTQRHGGPASRRRTSSSGLLDLRERPSGLRERPSGLRELLFRPYPTPFVGYLVGQSNYVISQTPRQHRRLGGLWRGAPRHHISSPHARLLLNAPHDTPHDPWPETGLTAQRRRRHGLTR